MRQPPVVAAGLHGRRTRTRCPRGRDWPSSFPCRRDGAVRCGQRHTANGAPPTAPPTTSSPPSRPSPRPAASITRSAHVAFEGCSSRHITLTRLDRQGPLPDRPDRHLRSELTNSGDTACGPERRTVPPRPARPDHRSVRCALGRGRQTPRPDVYPGKEVFSCPAVFGASTSARTPPQGQGDLDGLRGALAAAPPAPSMAEGSTRSLQRDRRQRGQRPLPAGWCTQRSLCAATARPAIAADRVRTCHLADHPVTPNPNLPTPTTPPPPTTCRRRRAAPTVG